MVFDCARVCGKSVATSEAAVIWQHSRFRSSKIGRWRNFPRTFFFDFVPLMLHLHPLLLMVLSRASKKMAKTFPRFCGTFWCETCSALCSFSVSLSFCAFKTRRTKESLAWFSGVSDCRKRKVVVGIISFRLPTLPRNSVPPVRSSLVWIPERFPNFEVG